MAPLCLSRECCIFSKITFYSQTAGESWNSPLTLTIDEVDDTTYDSYNAPFKATDNAQLSWSGSCTVTNGQWVIILDNPYVYTGGNLLISVRNTATGSGCPYSYFFGVSTGSINYAGYRSGGSDFDLLTITSRLTFLPKATFSYTAGGGAICYRPRNIVATAIDVTTTSATVTILDPNETGHYYMVIGTDSTEVFGSEAYLTDLLPGQFYNLRLYTVCDDTVLGPTAFSFSTSLEATTLPYTTGFKVDEDSLWTLVNGTNAWTLGSAAHSSGSRSLYISNDGSANAYSTGTACFSYAIRTFQIDEAGSYAYSFDWLGDGESSYDYLRAWFAPGTSLPAANAAPDGVSSSYNYRSTTPEGWVDLGNGLMNDATTWQTKNGDFNTSTSATISWTAGGSETRWAIDWGTGADTTANNPYTLTGLEPNTTYYVKVKALCADGNESGWSSPATFTTATVGIDDVDAAAISLYPNPATTTVTISGIEGQATVTVVDMNGREVHTQAIKQSSNQTITLDLTDYAQGAYFVRIVGEQQSAVRKLIVK